MSCGHCSCFRGLPSSRHQTLDCLGSALSPLSFSLVVLRPRAVRPRPSNVLVRGQLFSSRHSAAGGEGRTKTEEGNGECRIVQEVQFGCNLVLASLPSPSRLSLRRVDPEAERTSLFHRSANLTRKEREREGERERVGLESSLMTFSNLAAEI